MAENFKEHGLEALRKGAEYFPSGQLGSIRHWVKIVNLSNEEIFFKDYATSITQDASINVTNVAQAITPVANQVGLLLIPIAGGSFAWGGASLTTTNTYTFTQADAPIEIRTSGTIYVIRTAATAAINFTILRLLRT